MMMNRLILRNEIKTILKGSSVHIIMDDESFDDLIDEIVFKVWEREQNLTSECATCNNLEDEQKD